MLFNLDIFTPYLATLICYLFTVMQRNEFVSVVTAANGSNDKQSLRFLLKLWILYIGRIHLPNQARDPRA